MVAGRDYDAKDIIDDKDVGKISTPKPFAFNTYGRATIQERIRYPELNQ